MQKGFSLIELLVVSLFGGLLLLAASQLLLSLIRYQADQSELLRLTENATLVEAGIKETILSKTKTLLIGKAISSYPTKTQSTKIYIKHNALGYITYVEPFNSSDWLVIVRLDPKDAETEKSFLEAIEAKQALEIEETETETETAPQEQKDKKEYGVIYLDKKSFGFGLAYKQLKPWRARPTSRTLVDQVELLRFRYLPHEAISQPYCEIKQSMQVTEFTEGIEGHLITEDALLDVVDCGTLETSQVSGLQFAFIIVASKPTKKRSASSFSLWGQTLTPPQDGLYRQLITSTVYFKPQPAGLP